MLPGRAKGKGRESTSSQAALKRERLACPHLSPSANRNLPTSVRAVEALTVRTVMAPRGRATLKSASGRGVSHDGLFCSWHDASASRSKSHQTVLVMVDCPRLAY